MDDKGKVCGVYGGNRNKGFLRGSGFFGEGVLKVFWGFYTEGIFWGKIQLRGHVCDHLLQTSPP